MTTEMQVFLLVIWGTCMLADFILLGRQQDRIEKKIDNLNEVLAKAIARKP